MAKEHSIHPSSPEPHFQDENYKEIGTDTMTGSHATSTTLADEKQKPKDPQVEVSGEEAVSTASDSEYPKASQMFLIVLALALSMFLVSLDMTIISTAIPRITDQFHSLDDVGWYGTAFFLTLARLVRFESSILSTSQ